MDLTAEIPFLKGLKELTQLLRRLPMPGAFFLMIGTALSIAMVAPTYIAQPPQ
jgi:hypothetical protein